MRKHRTFNSALPLVAATLAMFSIYGCDGSARANASDTVATATPVQPAMDKPMRRELSAFGSAPLRGGLASEPGVAVDAAAAPPVAQSAALSQDAAPETGSPLPPASDPAGAMLVRHGQASIEVRHVGEAVLRIRQASQQIGGFVANTALRNGRDEQPSASLELRVPTAQFDQLISGLKAFGKVESVTANAEDVGEEYVDLGARAANARRVEARLVEMLASRTGKLSDVLTVEQELARVRQEIERHDARLRWLERRASLSSFSITLHEPLALVDRTTNGPIAEAFAEAWRRLLGVVAWFIAALGVLVPVALVLGGVVVVVRRVRRPRTGGAAAATVA